MKTIFTILLAVHLCSVHGQVREISTTSLIKDVTVFLKGAQVTRTAIVDVPVGTSLVVLSGTSPSIRDESIQAEAADNVKILGVSFRINHLDELKSAEQNTALQKEKDRLKILISQEQTTADIYEQEAAMLNANRSIAGNQTGVNVAELKVAVSYYRERMKEIAQLKQQCKTNIQGWSAEVTRIESQLSELKAVKPMPRGEVVVKVNSKVPARTTLRVSYLVQEAGWFPQYDVRAKDVESPIAITYKANVSQQSGEDWNMVALTISSGNPSLGGIRPVLRPWHLGFNNRIEGLNSTATITGTSTVPTRNGFITGRIVDENGDPVPGVNVMVKGTSMGTVSDANGTYIIAAESNSSLVFSFIGLQTAEYQVAGRNNIDVSMASDVTEMSEVVTLGYGIMTGPKFGSDAASKAPRKIATTPVIRQTDVEFHVKEPYTIMSGGDNETVEMVEYEVSALFQYYCAPKVDKDAFLTAKLTGWDEYNFLEGQASLFFEGKYLGRTVLDTRNTLDTLTISLGRDRNVLIEREKVKDVASTQFIGSNRKNVFAYKISVRNKKAQEIRLRIDDQVPLPNTKEITVDKLEDSGAAVDDETGLLTWNLRVPPGKTQDLELRYMVKYPRYSALVLE